MRPGETKFARADLSAVDADGTFAGYASVFGKADLARDMVMPGAFRASLAKRGRGGIKLLFQHDPNEPIGVWLDISEDAAGLFVRGRLTTEVSRAREVLSLMRAGALDGLSIGYRTVRGRDGDGHLDAADYGSGRDPDYLAGNIAGGEGFDWYYATDADRAAQARTPITDGAYGKPWVFRYKDIVSWWGNPHYDRPGGVENATPTDWAPEAKPIRFTELGCPAVDKGPNQPNVFPDPKSSAGAIPYFSTGRRDDLVQRRFLEAHLDYWNPGAEGFNDARNPVSGVYGGRMLEHDATHVWTWDARPFPMFPYRLDLWSDGVNWETGHWLTGRLGSLTAEALVAQIAADYGVDLAIGDLDGTVDGYVVPQVTSARRALEPLAQLLMFDAVESGETIRILKRGRRPGVTLGEADLAEDDGRPLVAVRRAQETELPSEISIGFADLLADYRDASVNSRRLVTGSQRSDATDTNATLTHAVATGIADTLLQDLWAGREAISFSLTGKQLAVEAADICTLDLADGTRTLLLTRIEDGAVRRIEARSIEPDILAPVASGGRVIPPETAADPSAPDIVLLDLPLISGSEPGYAPRIAAFADPWPGAIAVAIGTGESGYLPRQVVSRRATVGVLTAPLGPGPLGRRDRSNAIEVTLFGGALASEPLLAVLNGANRAAIGTEDGGYEVVQFETATLVGADMWRLTGLLRGQSGTIDIARAGHEAGADFVLLNAAVVPLDISEAESFLALTLRCGEAGAVYDPDLFTDRALISARRGLLCLAPARATLARDESGDLTVAWIRQTRIGGDPWEPADVPLGEASEAYRLEILDGDTVVRVIETGSPSATYPAAEQTADFGAPQTALAVRIRQVSPTEGPGLALETMLHA
jgi:HK97 family phage prohead protease